ncbi:MAG: DUF3098 domain-containing protein [Bacteroidales bacterium]|nr:DUF3098 domain-containing protein [Bacteroidales bacterium]
MQFNSNSNNNGQKFGLALGKENYKLMLIGMGIILLGFILMAGGGSDDPNVFDESVFSFTRITLAPIVVLFGFGFEIYAIMKKPKDSETDNNK